MLTSTFTAMGSQWYTIVLMSAALSGMLMNPLALFMELSSPQKRCESLIAIVLFFAVGMVLQLLFLRTLPKSENIIFWIPFVTTMKTAGWRILYMVPAIPCTVVTLFMFPFLPESVSFLIGKEQFTEAEETLKDIINWNGKTCMRGRLVVLLESNMTGVSTPTISVTDAESGVVTVVHDKDIIGIPIEDPHMRWNSLSIVDFIAWVLSTDAISTIETSKRPKCLTSNKDFNVPKFRDSANKMLTV
jgi:hypothetical protein